MLEQDSFILRKTATTIAVIVQVFAIYLFFRGHNLPGGGFIAGIASGIGVLLLVLANGSGIITRVCPFDPLRLCGWGLLISTASGLIGLAGSGAFLTHYHYKEAEFPVLGSIYMGTPLLFDLGVFLVVLGVIMKVTFVLLDALQGQSHFQTEACKAPHGIFENALEGSAPKGKEAEQ